MIELLIANLASYITQWCSGGFFNRKCEQVTVVKECREEYRLVEKHLILSPNVKDIHLVMVCREFEIDRDSKRTGRSREVSQDIIGG